MELENGTYLNISGELVRVEATKGFWVGYEETTLEDTKHGELVGVWVDDTGKVWVDRVWHYPELEEALEVARINNQLAIWDNANGVEVRV